MALINNPLFGVHLLVSRFVVDLMYKFMVIRMQLHSLVLVVFRTVVGLYIHLIIGIMHCNSHMKVRNDNMKLCASTIIRSSFPLERNLTSRNELIIILLLAITRIETQCIFCTSQCTLSCRHNILVQSMTVMLMKVQSILVAIQFVLLFNPNLLSLEDYGQELEPVEVEETCSIANV